MTRKWEDIAVTPGSLSDARLPGPLAPRQFMVRPQSLAQAFCAAGRRLGAEDVQLARNARDATPWARLFQAEPAYLFAEILSFNAHDAGFAFAEALEAAPDEATRLMLSLAKKLDGWTKRIRLDAPAPFSKQLDQLDKEENFSNLLKDMRNSTPAALIRLAEGHPTVQTAEAELGALAKARATRERLRGLHALLRNAVTSLQHSAQTAFDARITSGQIDPGLGLLLAELRTSAHVDAAFNQLPDRHTMLYYSDIIGQTPAKASPETVLLELGTAPRPDFLPHGTTLEARLPDGRLQSFETDAGVPLSPARVHDIRLLSFATDENVSYYRALGGITGIRAATLNQQKTPAINQTLFATGEEMPLDMGLDISSPMLSLAEGTRRIEVSLHMTRSSSLPAVSRKLTEEELEERATARAKLAKEPRTEDARRSFATRPHNADPEVRLALAADPALVAAFSTEKPETAIERLTQAVTKYARRHNQTASLGLIYKFLMSEVSGPEQLRLLLGRIVTLSLIEQHDFPKDEYWEQIYALIDTYREHLIGATPLTEEDDPSSQNSMIFRAFSRRRDGKIDYEPEEVFQSLLGDAFAVAIVTDKGPLVPDIMQVIPVRSKRAAGGITLALRYDSSAPPLTARNHAPRLTLRYAPDARLCPLSFFEAYSIETVTIRTQVNGLRRLTAFSDDAPVSTDQTFQPFGPRPREGASFVVGCPEMARKPVTEIGIRLKWSTMPNPVSGFQSYYEGYGKNANIPEPELAVHYLSGDGWKPVSHGREPFFQSEGVTGALLDEWVFADSVSGHSIAAQGTVTAQEFQSRQGIRAGIVRLHLTGTSDGFNAALYPHALVDAMRPRFLNRLLGKTAKIPAAPFVPEISDFELSYTAESTIELNAPDSAKPGESLRQITPFGSVDLFPNRVIKQARVFPERLGYGMLCLQLAGSNLTGPTTIAFCMPASGHLRRVPETNPIRWVYMGAHGWQDLPETAIASDTTSGLMRSGLLVFDLPEDAATNSSLMPPGGVWLAAVATRPNLDVFPVVSSARVNGVWVRRRDDSWKEEDVARKWSFVPAQTGLADLSEVPGASRTRPPEPHDAFVARLGERLRHRKRAVTPWDMERLVLEAFPEVWMAKALPHMSRDKADPEPGHVTLVVVPKASTENVLRRPEPARFDVATLERIRTWLKGLCHEGAEIDVVNPTFERLQVRAKVAVDPERENGAMAQMLSRDLGRSLSVWTADPSLRRFGWSLNVHMLRAHVAGLDYVRDVTDFSVLHLVGDDSQTYQLLDTGQDDKKDARGRYGPILRPRFPWSLPLSTRDHVFTIQPELKNEEPAAAGIGSLILGDMLIVMQRTTS